MKSPRHSLFEDAQALLTGTLLFALGVAFFQEAGLLTGGTAGITFLAHYASGIRFGILYFLINLPFYVFAYRALGLAFTVKTFVAVALLAGYSELLPRWFDIARVDPLFAAIIGGLLAGAGLLMLVRHRASLGGLGVLAVYLQERKGWRAGHIQLALDALIVGAAFFVVPPDRIALSALGALMLNVVLAINHRPGRYFGQ
jgi:uncharacterized membrane-anchored protein YitT (DUF2179 family)